MSVIDKPLWYAVQIRARDEIKALGHLVRQGYRIYLPRYAKRIRHARKTELVPRPLFPGYLFVRLNLAADGWRSIRSTVGVAGAGIVCFGGQPVPLPNGIVEGLKALEDVDGLIQFEDRFSFKRGDQVVILNGPFSRQLGLCDGITENQRIAILLNLLGRKVRVMLDVAAVEAA